MPLRTASFSRIATFQPLRPVRGSLATLFDQAFYPVSLHLRLPSGLLSLSDVENRRKLARFEEGDMHGLRRSGGKRDGSDFIEATGRERSGVCDGGVVRGMLRKRKRQRAARRAIMAGSDSFGKDAHASSDFARVVSGRWAQCRAGRRAV